MPCTPGGTTTTTLALCKPAAGETGWTAAINGNWDLLDAFAATVAAAAPVDILTGVGTAYVGVTSISVAIGGVSSDDSTLANRVFMSLTSAITGTTAGTWVVGNNQPKLDAGTVGNNEWWHVFIIKRVDTGIVDILYSLSPTTPTLPTSYTKQRRIGAFKTNGSAQVIDYVQDGDYFAWDAAVLDVNEAASATAVTKTLTVPTGVNVRAIMNATMIGAAGGAFYGLVSDLATADAAPSITVAPLGNFAAGAAAGYDMPSQLVIRTNTSAQVRMRSTSATPTWRVATVGWYDRRGRG